jgi:hypothetical protein
MGGQEHTQPPGPLSPEDVPEIAANRPISEGGGKVKKCTSRHRLPPSGSGSGSSESSLTPGICGSGVPPRLSSPCSQAAGVGRFNRVRGRFKTSQTSQRRSAAGNSMEITRDNRRKTNYASAPVTAPRLGPWPILFALVAILGVVLRHDWWQRGVPLVHVVSTPRARVHDRGESHVVAVDEGPQPFALLS